MIFETIASGGCRFYLIGCEQTCTAALIDPELSRSTATWRWLRATGCGSTISSTRIRTRITSLRPGSWRA
jgi:hypothetical protein